MKALSLFSQQCIRHKFILLFISALATIKSYSLNIETEYKINTTFDIARLDENGRLIANSEQKITILNGDPPVRFIVVGQGERPFPHWKIQIEGKPGTFVSSKNYLHEGVATAANPTPPPIQPDRPAIPRPIDPPAVVPPPGPVDYTRKDSLGSTSPPLNAIDFQACLAGNYPVELRSDSGSAFRCQMQGSCVGYSSVNSLEYAYQRYLTLNGLPPNEGVSIFVEALFYEVQSEILTNSRDHPEQFKNLIHYILNPTSLGSSAIDGSFGQLFMPELLKRLRNNPRVPVDRRYPSIIEERIYPTARQLFSQHHESTKEYGTNGIKSEIDQRISETLSNYMQTLGFRGMSQDLFRQSPNSYFQDLLNYAYFPAGVPQSMPDNTTNPNSVAQTFPEWMKDIISNGNKESGLDLLYSKLEESDDMIDLPGEFIDSLSFEAVYSQRGVVCNPQEIKNTILNYLCRQNPLEVGGVFTQRVGPPGNQQALGAHSMLIDGYDPASGDFVVRNHWQEAQTVRFKSTDLCEITDLNYLGVEPIQLTSPPSFILENAPYENNPTPPEHGSL